MINKMKKAIDNIKNKMKSEIEKKAHVEYYCKFYYF